MKLRAILTPRAVRSQFFSFYGEKLAQRISKETEHQKVVWLTRLAVGYRHEALTYDALEEILRRIDPVRERDVG